MTQPATPGAHAPGPLGPDHGYGPDIDHVLLSEDQIQGKIAELAAGHLARLPDTDGLPVDRLAVLPTALRRRVLRLWLRGGAVPDLQGVHLAAVDALLVRWRGQGRVDLPGGAGVVRTSGRLVLQPPVDRA